MTNAELEALFHRLGHICRFNGAVKSFYSVAHHTSIGLEVMKRDEQPIDAMRAFFVHDLPEAMLGLGDITRDRKKDPRIELIVGPLEREAFLKIGSILPFSSDWQPVVKYYDRLMAVAEVEKIASGIEHDSPDDYDPNVHGYAARRIWLQRYNREPVRSMRSWCLELWPRVLG